MFLNVDRECSNCIRLLSYRNEVKGEFPSWWNSPVNGFGDHNGWLLIVGLAPGKKGANRTGRPFTGDYAGDVLYKSLLTVGFATGVYNASVDDGIQLLDCSIINAVRCVPPANKPVTSEIRECSKFLLTDIQHMRNLRVILCLGHIAHNALFSILGGKLSHYSFKHRKQHNIGKYLVFDSYHCSRYNVNTKVLDEDDFTNLLLEIKSLDI